MKLFFALFLCLSAFARATPLEVFAEAYRDGVAFTEREDYAHVYATTTARELSFPRQVRERDRIIAQYSVQLVKASGEPYTERGFAIFYLEGERIVYLENAIATGEEWDLATAGQLADVATTAAGVAAGLTEANPIVGSVIGSPVGWLAFIGLKLGIANVANGAAVEDCIAAKQAAAGLGWGASAWNVGVMLANPVVGAVAAIAAGYFTYDRPAALKACAAHKLKGA